jgi:small subunit ribosomal protein S21
MAEVKKGPHDSIDKLLRKFKRAVKEEGLLDTLREKEFYEKPSERRKREDEVARRRNWSRQQDEDA